MARAGSGSGAFVPSSYPVPTDGPAGELLRALGRHPMRPGHIHLRVTAPGFRPVTTHVFVAGDPYLGSDAAFAVKEELVVEPLLITDPFVGRGVRGRRAVPSLRVLHPPRSDSKQAGGSR